MIRPLELSIPEILGLFCNAMFARLKNFILDVRVAGGMAKDLDNKRGEFGREVEGRADEARVMCFTTSPSLRWPIESAERHTTL